MAQESKAAEKPVTQLSPRAFHQSEMIRNQWHCEPEFGTPAEALLDPAYWAHVSVKMRRGDIICAFPHDNSYFSELIVIDAGRLFAKVVQLRCVEISSAQQSTFVLPEGFEIKFRGPRLKWSVLRGKQVMKEEFDRRASAEDWLMDHVKAMAA